jgi:cobalamin transport system permease protein
MRSPFLFSFLLLLLALLLSLAIGSVFIPSTDVWRALFGSTTNEIYRTILWDIRLPRTLLIALVGAALAGSGAAYQGLFRNPLADPFLIGVASGAGLGAILAMSVHWPYTTLGLLAVPLAAFITSLLTVYLVYSFAHVGGTVPTTNLILAGVAVSSFATSLTSFLVLRSTGEVRRAIGWLLGGVSLVGWDATLVLIPYLAIGLTTLVLSGYALNLL